MAKYDSGLTNLSYTNKDFNSIYSELLDLGDRISPKWKPSQSNESDPGALMLKLDAIIGDKNNYNIDKNILELFPSSVTQYPAAREIFDQCGYIMPYYKAAEVIIAINMRTEPEEVTGDQTEANKLIVKEDVNRLYALKDFTMLCNDDNDIVYTIIDADSFITSDGTTYEYKALQGTIKEYNLNNSNLITYNSLDYNNRLYFKELNIAENGIFIQNVKNDIDQRNYSDWIKVDNLMTEPLNTQCYKFGISKDGSKCYIEFPNDIANLIGQGLKIQYITTAGYSGNISEYTLNKFFEDTYAYVSNAADTKATVRNRYDIAYTLNDNVGNSKKITITTENVYIRNVKPSSGGADPETIEEAKKNYERTKNTFETLVSLRDYNNFLLNSEEVSNGFICDRSNDIQCSTKIVTTDGNLETIHSQVSNKTIKYREDHSIIPDDNRTEPAHFTLTEPELNAFDLKIYALKYVHPITNVSRFDLSFELASAGHLVNLKDDLEEIKCIQHDFQELKANEPIYIQLRYPIYAKIIPYNKLETLQQLEIQNKIATKLYESLNSGNLVFGEEIDYDSVYDTIIGCDNRIKSLILDDFDYSAFIIYKDADGNEYFVEIPETIPTIVASNPDSSNNEYTENGEYTENLEAGTLVKWLNTIKAKAILAGVTPLLETPDNNFNFSAAHANGQISRAAGKVTTQSKITINLDEHGEGSVVLTPNESIYLTTNNFITKETYTNNVKYFYHLNDKVTADSIYQLKDVSSTSICDYIIFFWKEVDGDTEPYYYAKYTSTSEFNKISPNFSLRYDTSKEGKPLSSIDMYSKGSSSATQKVYTLMENLIAYILTPSINSTGIVQDSWSISGKQPDDPTNNEIIESCNRGSILSGTKAITIKGPNQVKFNSSYRLYWVLNETENTVNNEPIYKLFKSGTTTYILKTGEYLFYSDLEGKTFSMLGPGTKLELSGTTGPITVKAKSYEEILYGAGDLLNDEQLWYILPKEAEITASEMMYYNIGAESKVKFSLDIDNLKESIYQDVNSIPSNIEFHIVIDKDKCGVEGVSESESFDNTNFVADSNRWSIVEGFDNKKIIQKSLKDCAVTYTYQDNTVQLPIINVADAVWSGYSILNLNCGPETEQTLYKHTEAQIDASGNAIDSIDSREQSITITKKLKNETNHIDPFTDADRDNNGFHYVISPTDSTLKIQSNYAVQSLGGQDIDITAYDMTGARYNNQFYSYSIDSEVDGDDIRTEGFNLEVNLDYAADTSVTGKTGYAAVKLTFPPNDVYDVEAGEKKAVMIPMLTFKDYEEFSIYTYNAREHSKTSNSYVLSRGTYYQLSGRFTDNKENPIPYSIIKPNAQLEIIPVDEQCKVFTLTLSGTSLSPLNEETGKNLLLTKGLKFFAQDVTAEIDEINLFIEVKNKPEDKTDKSRVKFLSIMPYNNESDLKFTEPSDNLKDYDLFTIIKDLDINQKFNYAHKVDDDILIENPLDPYSFLDRNHPYNQAAICKWDYKNSIIKITNKIK